MKSSLFSQSGNAPVAPKIIHYIWLGGVLPEKYLREMLKISAVAKRSGFVVNLWVDIKSSKKGFEAESIPSIFSTKLKK